MDYEGRGGAGDRLEYWGAGVVGSTGGSGGSRESWRFGGSWEYWGAHGVVGSTLSKLDFWECLGIKWVVGSTWEYSRVYGIVLN